MSIDDRLEELGIDLPEPPAAVASYVPFIVQEGLVFVSGQISMAPEGLIAGRLGENLELTDGQAAARQCGINILAQLRAACEGDLSRVRRIVRLGGFVNSTPDFTDQPKVIDGASTLMTDVFDEAGRHARAAVGVNVLPLGAAVEIDAVAALA
jgi:enamine deaminase RidA (YjgF/YER057c/UK114 family)